MQKKIIRLAIHEGEEPKDFLDLDFVFDRLLMEFKI